MTTINGLDVPNAGKDPTIGATGTTWQAASSVSIVDAGGFYTGSDVEAALAEIAGGGGGGGAPAAHAATHAAAGTDPVTLTEGQITNLVSDLATLVASVATKSPLVHTHPESDVTNLTTDLANLAADILTKAALSHTHPEGDVVNLVADLAGKAAASHSHAEADITNLVADLAAKQDTATIAETIDDRINALLVPGTNITFSYNDPANTLTINSTGGGGGATVQEALVNSGTTPQRVATVAVVDAAVTSSSKITVNWGAVVDTDENSPQMDDFNFHAVPGTGTFNVIISSFRDLFRGTFRLNYVTG